MARHPAGHPIPGRRAGLWLATVGGRWHARFNPGK
jgi:hypothetical protein